MPQRIIPEREPIGDLFLGCIQQLADICFLAPTPQPTLPVLAQGELIIRYGLRLLERPHLSIVPGLVALDYGEFLTGETAWEFLLEKSNLYPRSDVLGYQNDGNDEMIPLKWLDIAQAPQVLAYENPAATQPIAEIQAIIIPGENSTIASRILDYIPVYPTLDALQQSLNTN